MSHQWNPEQTIEPPLALQLIQHQFPNLKAEKILLLGAGWDNTAFLINEEFIFRFPRRKIALPLLEAEWKLLPKLANRVPLPIPFPEYRGEPTEQYPWSFLGYRMLPGFTACHANLSEKERTQLAKPIAQFLKALHTAPKELIADCPIPNDNMSRIDGALLGPKIKTHFDELKRLGLIDKVPSIQGNFRRPMESAIVHGDFYVRHLLVNERHQLTGVIDWGDMHYGDPAIDLSIAHSFLPHEAHAEFRRAYGGIDEATWELARIRAIYSCCMLALYGHHAGEPNLLREALRSLALFVLHEPLRDKK